MPNLIRTSSHGNEVNVAIYPAQRFARKITNTEIGRSYLKTEANGLRWYNSLLLTNEQLVIHDIQSETTNFASLDIYLFDGFSCSYMSSIPKTKDFLERAIIHYTRSWPNQQLAPIHGDLTLSNIVYTNQLTRFIDWEHFSNEQYDWGFDIVYLVLSSMYLPSPCNYNYTDLECSVFGHLWAILHQIGVNSILLERPFSYFQTVAQNRSHFQRILDHSPYKLFPMTATKQYIDFFENSFIPSILFK